MSDPKNHVEIKKNLDAFKKQKKDSSASRGGGRGDPQLYTGPAKWKPPTDEEKKANGRRTINEKQYYYHYKTKGWIIVDDGHVLLCEDGDPIDDEEIIHIPIPIIPISGVASSAKELNQANALRVLQQAMLPYLK